MNDLCCDIGYNSLNKYGEQLCGDRVEMSMCGEDTRIIVLADGMGSGVKANILSTLTSKIISTMTAAGMSVEECVDTVVSTLPVCAERGVAYSTFTILKIKNSEEAEIIRYDNPKVIFFRDGKNTELDETFSEIGGKTIARSKVYLKEGDIFVLMSDGCLHAGVERSLNFGWERKDIIEFLETFTDIDMGFTAKTLNTMLLDQCSELYGNEPGDDTTACTVKIRRREPVNLVMGPPVQKEDGEKMMSLFFSKEGKHIVCGGTTSTIAAKFLKKELVPCLDFPDPDIPPIAEIEGVDLVTEGVVTINRVLEYAKDYIGKNEMYKTWSYKKDGASRVARMLFEDATDVNFYVGQAVNPAHQQPGLPINFSLKMQLVSSLADALKKMGKNIKVSYF